MPTIRPVSVWRPRKGRQRRSASQRHSKDGRRKPSGAIPRYRSESARQYGVEQVIEHPLAEVLRRPNAYLSAYDLWELTQFYLEVHGRAFWKLDFDPVLGVVAAIWVLPAQNMQAKRYGDDSPNPIDYWEYSTGRSKQEFSLGEIVFFKFPDPRALYRRTRPAPCGV